MKTPHYTFIIAACIASMPVLAQNVGIGTSAPQARLHINDESLAGYTLILDKPTSSSNVFLMKASGYSARLEYRRQNQLGIFSILLGNSTSFTMSEYGKTGINNASPQYALDVVGDGAFSGNVGIGLSSAPTASLDVFGTFRYRGNSFPNLPRMGAVLTAVDASGNAQWQRPVVFSVKGLTASQSIPKQSWTKIMFKSSNIEINEGLYWDYYTSVFSAPVKGAYHFDAILDAYAVSAWNYFRIVVVRNGGLVKEYRVTNSVCNACGQANDDAIALARTNTSKLYQASTTFALEAGDKVWVEVNQNDPQGSMSVYAAENSTMFSGYLISRL